MANHQPIGVGHPSPHRGHSRTPTERGLVQMYARTADRDSISDSCKKLGVIQVDASEMLAILMRKAVASAEEKNLVNIMGAKGEHTNHSRRLFWIAIFQVIVASWKEITDAAVPVMESEVAREHKEMVERRNMAQLMKPKKEKGNVNPVDAEGG